MKLRKCNITLTALAALCLAGASQAADKPDFSGEWKLNVGKSDFGGRKPTPTVAILKIEHKDPVLKITRTIVTDNGQLTTEAIYSTDGTETTNKLPGGGEMKNTAKWVDSALLIETPVRLSGKEAFSIKWKWILSEDGRTLATVRTFAPGEPPQSEVYEKQ
jgi:hypothetical protein